METGTKQRQAAKAFVRDWTGKGYEKGETQRFWLDLLHRVFGVDNPTQIMQFEIPVKTFAKDKGSDFIDAYITTTSVLIEQKGSKIDLSAKAKQSDGMELTPYQQGLRYAPGLGKDRFPRWIVACNFKSFEVHDTNRPDEAPEVIYLENLEKEYHRLSFLVDETNVHLKKELEVSIQAGEIVGVLYEKLLDQYIHPESLESQKSLNKLCVRLVFCLYAEDAEIFGKKNMFHDYMSQFPASEFRRALIELFQVLDTSPEDRDPYMDEKLAAFPFVSGGMFAGDIEIPRITEEIRSLVLQRASDDFDWSLISPTIFGAVFESTLNPSTRRAGGMHYTSLENIHKVIDPLFLDDLKAELADIKAEKVVKTKKARAVEFQNKLASLKFLDPACGSGNFLTESYTWLRRLENECIKILYEDRVIGSLADPIKVSIYQFYGIEINDFACSVSQAALWIAETQMLKETDAIVGNDLEPLPLKDYHNIHEGNALRMDWNEVVPSEELNYIMGNPPFVAKTGRSSAQDSHSKAIMDNEQKDDKVSLLGPNSGVLDYVCCWFKKAALYIQGTTIKVAFVATDSICQGQQVAPLWTSLLSDGIRINFAYRFFKWDSEVGNSATVYVIIVGMSLVDQRPKYIFDSEGKHIVSCINPYLIEAPNILIESRNKPLVDVPSMGMGNQPIDNGQYLFSSEEKDAFIKKEPCSEALFHPWLDAFSFINGKKKYCLWLGDCSPREIKEMPECLKRVLAVRDFRLSSNRLSTKKLADKPTRFQTENMPKGHYVAIPEVSSGNRQYIPMGFLDDQVLCSNKLRLMPQATLYHFGILTSQLHMAWMRTVGGYFGPSYQYSVNIVYNNFPWPTPNDTQKSLIEQTAQAILDARSLFPDSSLADLYDPVLMPPELRKAHRANDAAVLDSYGFPKDASESEIVARLFKIYQELTANGL